MEKQSRWRNNDAETRQKIQWHPAFVAATKIEFEDEQEKLKFESEYQLSKKPMQIDLLILKKVGNMSIHKNIGKIFKGNNVLEYKSPTDYMGIDDFYKVYGYACFYKADAEGMNSIAIDDIMISLISKKYPRKMMEHLKLDRGYTIKKEEEGIYYVEGDIFPIQILVTSRLSKEKNLWLSSLTDQIERDRIQKLMEIYLKNRNNPLYKSVMTIIANANKNKFKEESNVKSADEILVEICKEVKEEKINALNRTLIEEGRMDDLIKATSDYEYQKKMMTEMEEKGII